MSIRTTAGAALDYLPFGSGAQSFQLIYPHYEDAANASLEYMNHAHNDYVEVFLEHGIPGLVLIGAALVFWIRQAGRQWRQGTSVGTWISVPKARRRSILVCSVCTDST